MKYLFCCGLLISSFLCIGQTREKSHIELTPIIGYSASYHIQAALFGSSSVSGIQLGINGNYYFNKKWSLRLGLLYQEMGTDKVGFSIFSDKYFEKTNYFTVPLTVNYHFGAKSNWYINYGLSIGILTKAEADYSNGNGFINIKNLANPIQFGINGGIGYKFQISSRFNLVIDNSNMIGLTDTIKQRSGKNFYMSLNLGIVFKI